MQPGATSTSASTSSVPRQGLIACARRAMNRRRHKTRRQQGTTKRPSECHTSVSSSAMIESAPLDTILFDENGPNFYQHLIQSRSWHDVQRHLRTDRGLNQLQDEPLVLHNALKYHAPLRLVNSILNRKEACLYETDAAQRNLLHIAAMSWSSPETIEYILQKRPRTIATEVDCDGRTPLHLLLASADDIQLIGGDDNSSPGTLSRPSSSIVQYRKMSSQRSPSQSAIQMLVNAAPETLNVEDSDHMSPIEYAILSNDSIQLKTIQQMRRRSEKQWKKTNKSNNTTTAGAGDDCDSSSSSSSGGSSLLLEIPLGSRRRRGEVLVGGEGGGSSHHRPTQRRVSRNAITA